MPAMSPLRPQLVPFLGYLLRKRSHQRDDQAAATELNWSKLGQDLPPGLELEWLGTSGFRMSYQGHTILIDPYVSRCPVSDLMRRRAVGPSVELANQFLDRPVNAVLIGHAHFDHVLDAPAIAKRDGAKVYGSRSAANLMGLYDQSELMVEVEPYKAYEVGPFEFNFTPSKHARLMLGLKVPYDGDISCEHLDELVPQRYNCGQVYGIEIRVAGVSFYHMGSCDLIEDAIRVRHVDYFLAGIAGRGFTKNFTRRILEIIEPKVIIPHHFDDFFQPLGEEMKFSFNVNFAGFVEEVGNVSQDFVVAAPQPLQTIQRSGT
jgi:L-ascorbate metabolism protein UlaG (beta-lactamase superfamily)